MRTNVAARDPEEVRTVRLGAAALDEYNRTLSEMYMGIASENNEVWTYLAKFKIYPGQVARHEVSAEGVWRDVLARLNRGGTVLRLIDDLRRLDSNAGWDDRLRQLLERADTSRPTSSFARTGFPRRTDDTASGALKRACMALDELRAFRAKLVEHLQLVERSRRRAGDRLPDLALLVVRHRLSALATALDLITHADVVAAIDQAGETEEFLNQVDLFRALLGEAEDNVADDDVDDLLAAVRQLEAPMNELGEYLKRALRQGSLRDLHELLSELQQRLLEWDKIWETLRALGPPSQWRDTEWRFAHSVASWRQTVVVASFWLPELATERGKILAAMNRLSAAVAVFADDEDQERGSIEASARQVVVRIATMIHIVQSQLIGLP